MKVIGVILAVLMLVSAVAVELLAANKTHHLTKDLDSVTEGLSDAQKVAITAAAGAPSTGRLKGGLIVGLLAALASLALLVTTFKTDVSREAVAGAAIGLTLLAIVVSPSIPTGPADGVGPRPLMIVALVLTALGASGAFLANPRASTWR